MQTCSAHNLSVLRIGMEATGPYWWHVHQALSDAPELEPYDVRVAVLNPKVVQGFKAVYTDIPKIDLMDAWVIADCLRFGRVHFHPPTDPRYAPPQRLTKYRETRHHHHKRALVLTARKLVRPVYALLSEGQIYVPKRGIA